MYMVFFNTGNVFRAEEILKSKNIACKIVPTPVSDKAYCGVCVQTECKEAGNFLTGTDFDVIA